MTDYSLIELLSLRKWSHALFTTYALSLTFFESYVLPPLRKQECKEIFLISDIEGYQMSLSERRSNRVGQEYHLIPVALENGVFHPKCIYLSSNEGDMLAIGSGNMTFGGFGKNLEVYEILDSDSNPQAFVDFSDFLQFLEMREDLINPERKWINLFSNLAQKSVKGEVPQSDKVPALVHSVVGPVVDQIAALCNARGGGRRLTVLSPFHDPGGKAVKKLAIDISAQQIDVALPTKQEQNTTFPFPLAASWPVPVGAVKPLTEEPNRRLHAKWIEIGLENKKTLTLTGSVNATSKSMCSADNIEVGIVRIHSGSKPWIDWERVAVPTTIDKQEYRKAGIGKKCLLHARLKKSGLLRGTIIASGPIGGKWTGFLENGSADRIPLTLDIDHKGFFSENITGVEDLIDSSGLQLDVSLDAQRARGWVNQDDILQLTTSQRLLLRLIRRDGVLDDDVALLDFLSQSAHQHLPTFVKPIKIDIVGPQPEGNQSSQNVTVSLIDIAPDSNLLTSLNNSALCEFSGKINDDIFSQLRQRLLGHLSNGNSSGGSYTIEAEEDDDPDQLQAEQIATKQLNNRLERFESCLKECIESAPDKANRKAALIIWLEVTLYMLQRHLERDKAISFIRAWFWKACSEKLLDEEVGPFEQHLFTLAAVCARLVSDTTNEYHELVVLHGGLEKCAGGNLNTKLAEKCLLDHPAVGFSSFLLGSNECQLHKALKKVLAAKTIRQMLSDVVCAHSEGRSFDETYSVFSSAVGKKFLTELKRSKLKMYQALRPGPVACAFCSMVLTPQMELNLKYQGIALCIQCNKFTVNLEP